MQERRRKPKAYNTIAVVTQMIFCIHLDIIKSVISVFYLLNAQSQSQSQ